MIAGLGGPVLTDDEQERLLRALLRRHGTATEAECLRVLHWATEARVGAVLLELVLVGRIGLSVRGDEVVVSVEEGRG